MPDDEIRILIVGSQLVRELLETTLRRDPELSVVGSAPDFDRFPGIVESTRAEFVIVGSPGPELPEGARRFLDQRAQVKVLGIHELDGRAFLYKLRPEMTAVGEVSPDEVATAIKAAATGPASA